MLDPLLGAIGFITFSIEKNILEGDSEQLG